jgi:Arm DNA-binding domain
LPASRRWLALGTFPATSLADARAKRDAARAALEQGVDPSVQRKLDRIAAATQARNTFGAVAEEYLENLRERGLAETTIAKNKWLLQDLASPIATRPIAEITPAEFLYLLKMVEKSGRRETARRLRGIMGTVFRYAVVTLRANGDPTFALQGALLPPNTKSRAAITDEKRLGALLRSIAHFDGYPTIRAAPKFLALTVAGPGEVRGATRDEFNFEKSVWRISADRIKTRKPHDVPLSRSPSSKTFGNCRTVGDTSRQPTSVVVLPPQTTPAILPATRPIDAPRPTSAPLATPAPPQPAQQVVPTPSAPQPTAAPIPPEPRTLFAAQGAILKFVAGVPYHLKVRTGLATSLRATQGKVALGSGDSDSSNCVDAFDFPIQTGAGPWREIDQTFRACGDEAVMTVTAVR